MRKISSTNNKAPSRLKSMRLSENVVKSVQSMADNQNRSFSNMVETLLKESISG